MPAAANTTSNAALNFAVPVADHEPELARATAHGTTVPRLLGEDQPGRSSFAAPSSNAIDHRDGWPARMYCVCCLSAQMA
jgi:hypothetical protein